MDASWKTQKKEGEWLSNLIGRCPAMLGGGEIVLIRERRGRRFTIVAVEGRFTTQKT